jgi:hypothetical protein
MLFQTVPLARRSYLTRGRSDQTEARSGSTQAAKRYRYGGTCVQRFMPSINGTVTSVLVAHLRRRSDPTRRLGKTAWIISCSIPQYLYGRTPHASIGVFSLLKRTRRVLVPQSDSASQLKTHKFHLREAIGQCTYAPQGCKNLWRTRRGMPFSN